MNSQAAQPKVGIWPELLAFWRQIPDKGLFLALLCAWLALFQILGNSTFGYIDTPSLLRWMYVSYTGDNSDDGNASLGSFAGYVVTHPVAVVERALKQDDGHGLLIPLVVVALMFYKRKELLARLPQFWWPGLLILAGALVMHLAGYLVQQPRVSILAFFTGIYGLMGMVWGRDWLRASFFPFFLFLFCVPVGSIAEGVTFPLRMLATTISVWISRTVLGVDVVQEGSQMFDAQHTFAYDVAPACSGIRSLIAIVAISTIFGFVEFRTGWKRALLIGSAVPLAVIGNVMRLLTIIVAAETFGQSAGEYVHESSWFSLIPYVPPIIGLTALAHWLREPETRTLAPSALEAKSA